MISDRFLPKMRVALLLFLALEIAGCSKSERAQSYYDNGTKLFAQHENQKAAIEFRNAINLKKDMLPAWRGLAQVDEAEHQWQALVPVLQGIIELDPKDVEARLKLARLMLLGGAADQALKVIDGIDERDRSDARVLAVRAAISLKLKDTAAAVSDAQAALKLDPNSPDATLILAAERLNSGDAKGALQIIDATPDRFANNLGIQLFKLRIYDQLKDTAQIEAELRKLTELYPQDSAFRRQLIRFYVSQKRFDDAEKELRTEAADAKNSDVALDLIRFLYSTKGADAALQEIRARIVDGGNVFPYQIALADLEFAQNNHSDSFKLLETLADDPKSPEHALAAKIKLAELNYAAKNVDAAEGILDGILAKDSRNASALKLRAVIRLDRNQLEPAISDLRQALNDQPRSMDLMLLLATAYERSGDVELAEKQFADATRASNYNPSAGLNYVGFLRRRGSLQRAEEVLNALASRNPNDSRILKAMAEVKLAHGDWVAAQQIGEALRKIGDRSGIADEIVGTALNGEGKYEQSIAAFQNAVSAAPSAVQPMVLLVRELVNAKQTDRAVSFLQSVLKSNPGNAQAYVLLGSLSLANHSPDQAANNFRTAIEKQPKDIVGYRALAELYMHQNKVDDALDVIRAGIKELPDDDILHTELAMALEQSGDFESAIAEYQKLIKHEPDSVFVANNLASLLSDHRTDKASLEQAQQLAVVLRKSQLPQYKDTLGWITYQSGDVKGAVPLLEAAVAALPNVAVAHYHLGMAYAALGENAKASEEFKVALTKSPDSESANKINAELKKTDTQ